eukprot:SM000166S02449  [mRNA]  locus=s166:571:2794:+ [translate_table: standard]
MLAPMILRAGPEEVLAVDLSEAMLGALKERHDAVRCWHGDIVDLPATGAYGPFDAVFFNGVFGNMHSQRNALAAAAALAKAGGKIVISDPLGKEYVEHLQRDGPDIFPHSLPNAEELAGLAEGLSLSVTSLLDKPDLYLAVLTFASFCEGQKPGASMKSEDSPSRSFAFQGAPLRMRGKVVSGFGRGSKQMGIPTANLPPEELEEELKGLAKGVYCGFAQLLADGLDRGVHQMVMNVGERPTFVDGKGTTVEVHILHNFGRDFYGEELRVVTVKVTVTALDLGRYTSF